jgi:serine protease
VNAPAAWANARAAGRPGAKGVKIAILDSGIAYRTVHRWKKSPDFAGTHFLKGWDYVGHDATPIDFYGHGTHVAGTIAEATGNGYGVTGLAYGASIIPVRVLDKDGYGDDPTIAKGIRYAVKRGAQLINLSLEFPTDVRAAEIPSVVKALAYARRHGVLVVGAAGNEGDSVVAYPARARDVLSVSATTRTGCLAQYSNVGGGLDLVAPGGGDDADVPGDVHCDPNRRGSPVFQMTFNFTGPGHTMRFGLPRTYEGTSMATPHVTGIAALAIASGAVPRNWTPASLTAHLERTARDLGKKGHDSRYGYGLVDGAAATAR